MAGAAYQWDATCTDDETYKRELVLTLDDGSLLPVADFAFEYSLKGCGIDKLLTEASGITKDATTATLTITPGVDFRFPPGMYRHGLRMRHLTSGQVVQLADGTLTVTEGNF